MKIYNILLSILFFTVTLNTSAQRTISGRITDAEDGEPIPGASVFIAGTTVGMTSDNEGYYRLKIPGPGSYTLAVSHAGYQLVFIDIEPGKSAISLNVEMNYHELAEVSVTAKIKFRKQDIDLFWETILGMKPNKNIIFAANTDAVYYYYNRETNILTVTCRVPLQIFNLETGYHIEYVLDRFTHDYNTNISFWEAQFMFTELTPVNVKQENTWKKNREIVYNVSVNKFIKSLYNNSLNSNGFVVLNLYEPDKKFSPITDRIQENLFDNYQFYDPPSIRSRMRNSRWKEDLKNKYSEISFLKIDSFLSIDSITDSKTLFLPSDSNILLVCFGIPIIEEDLSNALSKKEKKINFDSIKIIQNIIKTPEGSVQIFPDGTFQNTLQLSPKFFSVSLTGLNMALPIDYNSNPIPEIKPNVPENLSKNNQLAENRPKTALFDNPLLNSLDNIVKNFETQLNLFPQEKVYLQNDKPYYLAGELIWFRAHVVDAASHIPLSSPNCVYVELFNARDSAVCRVKTGFENDIFSGYIAIPEDLPEGDYTLRAYTNRMRDLGEDYFFLKSVGILNPINPLKALKPLKPLKPSATNSANTKPLPENDFDVSFFPEGGQALFGCLGRVAVKAMKSSGTGCDIVGTVYDRQGKEITSFKTDIRGMGFFMLTPLVEETYYAICTNSKGQSKRFELPAAKSVGYALTSNWNKDNLLIKAQHPESFIVDDTLFLLVHTRGIVQDVRIIDDTSKPVVINKSLFPSGVSNLLLLTKNMIPVSERLVFVNNEDQAKVTTITDKEIYNFRSPVEYTVNVIDESGEPLSGNFSVSITDDNEVAVDTTSNILTSLLLSSDLRGNISNPAFYFQKTSQSAWALELLMMTQGWRRYDTERIFKNDFMYPDTMFEKGFEISGTVKGLISGKPEENAIVSFFALNGNDFGVTFTDRKGRFYLYDSGSDPDSTRFIVQTKAQVGNRKLVLTLDKNLYPERKISLIPSNDPEDNMFQKYVEKAERKYVYENGKRIIQLSEVTVMGQKKPKKTSSYYANPDRQLTEEEIDRIPPTSMNALLLRLAGVKVRSDGTIYISRYGADCPAAILIDDFPVQGFNIDWLEVSDIAQVDLLTSPTNLAALGKEGGCGAIAIYTRIGKPGVRRQNPNISSIVPLGFQKPVEFYSPKYDMSNQNTEPDLRTTIHWQPLVITDENGKASFKFYTADSPTTYSVLIEGIADDGRIIYKRDKIMVGTGER